MKNININPSDLSVIFWNKILENSYLKSEIYREEFFSKIDSLDKLRVKSDYNTGSITSTTSWLLYSLVIYFKPETIIEVGSFIGKSIISMALGADTYKEEYESKIYCCDMSNDITLPKLSLTKITQFNKTKSQKMFKELDGKHSFDLIHIDGRLGNEDFELIKKNISDKTIFVLDDFEGKEKGVINYIQFLQNFNNSELKYLLVYPIQNETLSKFKLVERSTSALLLPTRSIGFTNQ